MRKVLLTAVLVALVVSLSVTAMAATWTKIGSSGLVANPSTLQDWWRPVLNHMAVDNAGNVYVTANNGNNRGVSGGITIFQTNGSKIDIDLNALGYQGGVTKLVKAGDGKVYALQNWREAWASVNNGGGSIGNFRVFSGEGLPDKILRIEANGAVTKIHEAQPVPDGWVVNVTSGTTSTIVDIDGTNKGIKMERTTAGAVCQYYRMMKDVSCTIAARFQVSAYTPGAARTDLFLLLPGKLDVISTPFAPFLVLGIDPADSHVKLWNLAGGATVLQDLGLLNIGAYNEVYLHADGTTGLVKVKWNGTEYSTTITDPTKLSAGTNGWVQFGAGVDSSASGATTVIFDWAGYGRGYLSSETPTDKWVVYNGGNPFYASDGTTVIWDGRPMRDNNRIQGLVVGGDGNLYFTSGSINAYWKSHFLWRYNVNTNALTDIQPAVNNGWSFVVAFSDLEYFGKDALGEDIFGLIKQQDSAGSDWRIDAIKADFSAPATVPLPRTTGGTYAPYSTAAWGRHFVTKTAYDSIRQKFWAGGWAVSGGYSWNAANANGGTTALVDLGSGNKGLACTKAVATDPTKPQSSGWTLKYTNVTPGVGAWQVPKYTAAARFKINSGYTGMSGARFLFVRPHSLPKPATMGADQYYGPGIGVGIDSIEVSAGVFEDHWVVSQKVYPIGGTAYDKLLVDLGPVTTDTWNEAYIYAESTLQATPRNVKVWWNGTKVFDANIPDEDGNVGSDGSWIQFGNHCGSFWPAPNGAAVVTFDWAAAGRDVIAPSDATKKWDYYFNGSAYPQFEGELKSHVMIQYNGDFANGTFLDSLYKIKSTSQWHANDQNPQVMDHKRAPGYYWLSALAVNPSDGKAWMGWNAESNYIAGDIGRVITRDINIAYGDEGVPEAGAALTGLMFANDKVYASVCNLSTGVYSLYAADAPAPGPQAVAGIKSNPVGTMVSTDVAKVVTYPAAGSTAKFFYIEDADRTSGIKVIAKTADMKFQGEKVNVTGLLDVVDGEVVIRATTVSSDSSGNADPEPIVSTVKNLGGQALGAQPATNPAVGLNNTGLLMKVAGKVAAYVTDDIMSMMFMAPNWFTIDDGSGAQTVYQSIAGVQTVPGIKVLWDPGYVEVGAPITAVGVVGLDAPYEYDSNHAGYELYTPGQRVILPRVTTDVQVLTP